MPSRKRGRPAGIPYLRKTKRKGLKSRRADLTDKVAESIKWPYPRPYDKPPSDISLKAIEVWNRPRDGEPSFAEQEKAYYAQYRVRQYRAPDSTETLSRCGRVGMRDE